MKTTQIDIAALTYDPSHFGPVDLLLTIKSFDLQSIRKRYLASKARGTGRTGSVSRRKPGKGGVVVFHMEANKPPTHEILWQTKEPRGIDWQPSSLTLAAENTIYLLDRSGQVHTITDPWLSYIHTVAWSPHENDRLLVSSSGLDMLQIYAKRKREWEWLAWEHGFKEGFDTESRATILLTRQPSTAQAWTAAGRHHLLVDQPKNTHLPTAMRAAFINSAVFDPDEAGFVIATFFHAGKVYRIEESHGVATSVIENLHHPHGGRRFDDSYMATSTASGEVVLQHDHHQKRYSVAHLPGKPAYLADKEWVQNTIVNDREWIIIDSNRTAFIRVDPQAEKYCIVPYPDNWAVQDGVPGQVTPAQRAAFRELT